MRIAYLDCFSGISGDMLLGAMVDAGVPLEHLSNTVEALGVGARLEARKVMRGGIAGTKVDVIAPEEGAHEHTQQAPDQAPKQAPAQPGTHTHTHTHHDEHGHAYTHSHEHEHGHMHGHAQDHQHPHGHAEPHAHSHAGHRSLSAILGILRASTLSDAVRQQASAAFQLLGEAEAAIHAIPVEQVHFHEVGAVDTIVDIVCAAAGAAYLGIDRWYASPLNVGSGTVDCAHGRLPVPAPATLKLLGDAPIYAAGPPMERVTPTGATLLRMLHAEFSALPAMRAGATGYGAGGRDTPGQPNLLRLVVGEAEEQERTAEPIAILETVIDDSTPQLIAHVSELLLAAGAWDVYRIPVQMKKGRTGVQVTVLCAPERLAGLRDLLFRETTTIGAHWRIESKMSLAREMIAVETRWGSIRMKVARGEDGRVLNASAEYEDCRALASRHQAPLKQVMLDAAQAWAQRQAERNRDGSGAD